MHDKRQPLTPITSLCLASLAKAGARSFLGSSLLSLFLSLAAAALGAILSPRAAHASSGFVRVVEMHPLPHFNHHAEKCEILFGPLAPFQVVETEHTFVDDQVKEPTQRRYSSTTQPASIQPIVDRVITDWVSSRDFTPAQGEFLKARARELDPRRTIYLHLETDGYPAILRIFDASSRVLRGGTEWMEATVAPATSPIELTNPSYELPERRWERQDPRRPAYIWEFGFLNVDRQLATGVETALRAASEMLDLHYNDLEFRLLKKTTALESRRMVIYAQTRPNRVDIFKKYGFQPHIAVGSNAQAMPFEVSPNLILMSMKAEDFLRAHGGPREFARTRKSASPNDLKQEEQNLKELRAYLSRIDARRIPIHSITDVQRAFEKVFASYVQARTLPGQTQERHNAAIEFFESFLTLINSIPEPLRHTNWVNMRNVVRECLSQSHPWDGLFFFSLSMDRIEDPTEIEVTQELFHQFYSTQPTQVSLSAPSTPMPKLIWRRRKL